MNLRFFGHSAFQISTDSISILVDPFITDNPLAEGIITGAELNPDVILLTHAHGDHWGDTAEIATRTGALVIANFEIIQYLKTRHHHQNVHAMNTGGGTSFEWGRVTQTWARHSSSFPDGTYGGNPGGYVIEVGGRCVYAAGDTSPFAEMAWIGEDYALDYALLPVGDCFTMGPEASCRAAKMLNSRVVIPIHYNTFPAIEIDIEAWRQRMKEQGQKVSVLSPGESIEF